MKLYRIYTEDKQREDIDQVLKAHGIDSYTLIPTQGYWQGAQENSLIIEILSDLPLPLQYIAQSIKLTLNREAVLYTAGEVEAQLV